MAKELEDSNWIRSLQNITTTEHLESFVLMWTDIQEVQLLPQPDRIAWRWTPSGTYTAASAYKCQFLGAHPPFDTDKIWKANAEAKCRFFAWLVAHGKIRTAENLALRGWPHDPICKLCHIHPETVQHICHECSFTKVVRDTVLTAYELPAPNIASTADRDFDG